MIKIGTKTTIIMSIVKPPQLQYLSKIYCPIGMKVESNGNKGFLEGFFQK